MSALLENVGLYVIRKITDLWAGAKAESLIDYTQVARVEPIVLIDADCLYLDSISEVQQSLLSIFAGYYLQAVAISTTVGKIEVRHHLDKLNPRRSPSDSAANTMGWLLAQESYKHRLPIMGDSRFALEAIVDEDKKTSVPPNINQQKIEMERERLEQQRKELSHKKEQLEHEKEKLKHEKLSSQQRDASSEKEHAQREKQFKQAEERLENERKKLDQEAEKLKHDKTKTEDQKASEKARMDLERDKIQFQKDQLEFQKDESQLYNKNFYSDKYQRNREYSSGYSKDSISDLKELSNLSVGKMLSVEITDGKHKTAIPIAVRLMASSIPSASLVHILSMNSQDITSAKERYHAWRAGRLEFIKDLILCQDLIDAHRKNLMHDRDGIYSNLLKRNRTNQLSTILSGNPSVAAASNLVIMSNDTLAQLELHLDGKFSSFKIREDVFKTGNIMIMVIIDKAWDRCTFYHRGINGATEVSIKDLKATNKGSGPNVSDILAAYRLGNSPSL